MTYDLFAHQAYPNAPGFRHVDTSREAAESIAPSAKSLQAMALRAIKAMGPAGMTTNELAEHLRIDRGSIQPRTSELKAQGKIIDSGRRRRNGNGKKAIVWQAVA